MHAVPVLLDQVLLLATLVGMFGRDLGSQSLSVIGNVKKRNAFVKQSGLALKSFEALPNDHHAVVAIAGVTTIIELGNMRIVFCRS
jgi:hypothetical protein